MKRTEATSNFENQFSLLGRKQKQELLENSNLNDRELTLLSFRFINGYSLKECAEELGLEVNTVSKNQLKAIKKLYEFIKSINNTYSIHSLEPHFVIS